MWKFIEKTDTCWLWTGSLKKGGYGQISVNGIPKGAHRVAYEALVGPIPESLHLDHLCRNKRCVRPEHLDPVTNRENGNRGLLRNRPRPGGYWLLIWELRRKIAA